jgi:predicted DNA-binding transcriptional regulator AlpA
MQRANKLTSTSHVVPLNLACGIPMEWVATYSLEMTMLRLSTPLSSVCTSNSASLTATTRPTLAQNDSLVLAGYLRRDELAQALGISPRTIDRWQALREGPPRVHVGRTILYNIESVRDWLRSREQRSSPTTNRPRLARRTEGRGVR